MQAEHINVNKLIRIQELIWKLSRLDDQLAFIQKLSETLTNSHKPNIFCELIVTDNDQKDGVIRGMDRQGNTQSFKIEPIDNSPMIPGTGMNMNELMASTGQLDTAIITKPPLPPNETSLEIDDVTSIKILHMVFQKKVKDRTEVISQLKELGVL